jgi:hypothetical protein
VPSRFTHAHRIREPLESRRSDSPEVGEEQGVRES